jgi:phage regulator Rha-like protein
MNSLEVAKEIKLSHYSITKTINKYMSSFEELGEIEKKQIKDKKGRPTQLITLNNKHIKLLICLLKNNPQNLKLKVELIKKN